MKPSSKKSKGSRLEREFAALLRGYNLDKSAQRMPLSGAFNDSRMKADILTHLPIHFEVKNQETWSPLQYYQQASGTAGSKVPIVIMSRNREQIYCFFLASDLLTILQFAIAGGWMGKSVLAKPLKPKQLALEETSGLRFSKLAQAHRKPKL